MKMKYLGMLIAMAIVNTSCTDLLISYPDDYYDDYNYDYNLYFEDGCHKLKVKEMSTVYLEPLEYFCFACRLGTFLWYKCTVFSVQLLHGLQRYQL